MLSVAFACGGHADDVDARVQSRRRRRARRRAAKKAGGSASAIAVGDSEEDEDDDVDCSQGEVGALLGSAPGDDGTRFEGEAGGWEGARAREDSRARSGMGF